MAEEKDIADVRPAGGRKKLIIISVAAVLLLLGAGGAAVLFLASEEEQLAAGDLVEEEVVAEQADPVYQALAPAFIVNLPPGGSANMLQIAIEVMTRNPTVIDTLKANDPMIRHHVLNLLEEQQSADLLTIEGKQRLQMAIHGLLAERLVALKEPGEIQGIFFTQFVMQ